MAEINLMRSYPQRKRNLDERAAEVSEERKEIARQYGQEYFHGGFCYNNYQYKECIWQPVMEDMANHYGLTSDSKVLDVGCAMGYALTDLQKAVPGIAVRGVDISPYAIEHAHPDVADYLEVGDAKDLSRYADKEFDLAISISTIHNLPREECKQALSEMQRVAQNAFITVDAWRTDEQKEALHKWLVTAHTFMHTDDWEAFFDEAGYKGDYYWFNPIGI